MRKVLVCGTALAVASLSGAVVPAGAWAQPEPAGSGTPTTSGSPAAPAPSEPVATPDGSSAPVEPSGGGITARAVMVTPPPPNTATYSYGEGPRRQLDVYWRTPDASAGPDAQAARPGVLVLHGGYWMAGDKRSWRYIARKLTSRGYVVFAANYSLVPHEQWPTQRRDVRAALRYVKNNAHLWNLDPTRIVVLGSSAGGHLATQLGTHGRGAQSVRGVVALSPVVSLQRAYHDGGELGADASRVKLRQAVRLLVGCDPQEEDAEPECLERVEDATPVTHAGPGDAPMLLVHGTEEFVPVEHSEELAGALQAGGVPATVRTVPGPAHGGELLRDESTQEAVFSWIDSVAKE